MNSHRTSALCMIAILFCFGTATASERLSFESPATLFGLTPTVDGMVENTIIEVKERNCLSSLSPTVFMGAGLGGSLHDSYDNFYGWLGPGFMLQVCKSWEIGLSFAYQWDNFKYEFNTDKSQYISFQPRFNYYPSCLSGLGPFKPYLGIHGDFAFGSMRYYMNDQLFEDTKHNFQALNITPGFTLDIKGPLALNFETHFIKIQRNYKTSNLAKLNEPYMIYKIGPATSLFFFQIIFALGGLIPQ